MDFNGLSPGLTQIADAICVQSTPLIPKLPSDMSNMVHAPLRSALGLKPLTEDRGSHLNLAGSTYFKKAKTTKISCPL